MKRQIALVALALSLVSSLAMAADDESVDVSLGIVTSGSNTSKAAIKSGYYLGLGVGPGHATYHYKEKTFQFSNAPAVTFQGGYRFNKFFRADLAVNTMSLTKDVDYYSTSLIGYGTLPLFDGIFTPYVGLGLGYLSFDVREGRGVTTGSTGLGVAAALGSDFQINKNWAVNVDLRVLRCSVDARHSLGLGQLTAGVKYYL